METMMYRAYHRWMDDYCGAFPARITGVILVSARDVARGLEEIALGAEALALGALVCPYGMPLDHPTLEPSTGKRLPSTIWGSCCIRLR